jgi:mono/diheme cytochrome c family protein
MRFLIILTITSAALRGQQAPKGDAKNGQKLFESYGCYQCHGHVGQGGGAGARIARKPIPWAAFSKYVRHPLDQMPPYTEKVVPDNQLADIYAYLESIPPPPAAKSVPLLNQH